MTSSGNDPNASPLNDPQLKELFFELSELDAAQCNSRLSTLAMNNPSLAQLLRELLEASEQEAQFLETPASQLFADLCEEVDLATRQLPTERQMLLEAIRKEVQNQGSRNLGPFRLIRLLHVGSEGGLYLAKDQKLDRLVALRLLTERQLSNNSRRKRILDSIALAAKIRHPSVAMVLGVFEFGELTAISREWIQGIDLQKWAQRRSSLRFEEVVEIGTALLEGVRSVHEMGLVHGDIKPHNIILRPNTHMPVLVDFGLVKSQRYWAGRADIESKSQSALKSQDTTKVMNLSESRTVGEDSSLKGGTPHFMAPELFKKNRASVRSDLFAVGVVLYWLSTKQYPYAGEHLSDLMENLGRGEYRPLETERPDFPQPFCHLIDRLVAPAAANRPSSVSQVQDELKPWSGEVTELSDGSLGRRRWLKEAALWGGSTASGAGIVLAMDRIKKWSLMNDVPPFLPEKAARYYFSAKDENDAHIQSVSRIEFGEFKTDRWGKVRLAYPSEVGQWGWIQFRPINLQESADYSLVNLSILEAAKAVECALYIRLSAQDSFQRVQRRKYRLYIWDISKFWKQGSSIELRLGMKYQGKQWLTDAIPPIGLRTIKHPGYSDPPVNREQSGSVVGWRTEEK